MGRAMLNDVRSEALFASSLQGSDQPTPAQVRDAIATAMRTFGSRGCAERMAQEFGDHPDTAIVRMSWARRVVATVFASNGANRPPSRRTGKTVTIRCSATRSGQQRTTGSPTRTVPGDRTEA
jgi:hypothetical protein